MLRWRGVWLVLALLGLACCAPSTSRYPWTTDQAALSELARRAAAVKTVEASCSITMRDESGQRITMDGALVAQNPGFLRVRAWKLQHAALDITARPDGIWIDAPATDQRFDRDELG